MSQPTNPTASTGTGTSVEDLQGLADELALETAISIDTEKVGSGNGNAWVKCGAPHTLASLVQIEYICNTNLHMPAPKTRGRTPRRAPATPTKGAKDKSSPPRFPIDQLEYVIIQNIDKIKGILPEDVQKEKLESYAKEWEVVKLEIGESRGAKTPCPKKISKEDKLIKGALLSISALLASSLEGVSYDDVVVQHLCKTFKDVVKNAKDLAKLFQQYTLIGPPLIDSTFGILYKALCKETKKHVAIKFVRLGKQSLEDTEKEFKVMKRMVASPLALNVISCSANEMSPFIVMEWADGGNLHDFVQEFLNEAEYCDGNDEKRHEQVMVLFITLLWGLVYHHVHGVTHRDVKLENIMLRITGDVSSAILVDHGLASTDDEFGSNIGTPGFKAPEVGQVRAPHLEDVYAMGVTFALVLTGDAQDVFAIFQRVFALFQRKRNRVNSTSSEVVTLRKKLEALLVKHGARSAVINLVMKMTKPDPKERISAADALSHECFTDADYSPFEDTEAYDWCLETAKKLVQRQMLLVKNVELAENQKELGEEIDGLKTKNIEVEEKLDLANRRATKAEDEAANLQVRCDELEKKLKKRNDAAEQVPGVEEQFAGMQLDVAADFHVSIATIKKLQGDIDTLASFLMKSSSPLSFVQFTKIFDKESSTSFLDTFFNEYPGEDSKFASLFAFAASFDCTWSHHQKQSAKAKKLLPVTSFLDCYAPAVSGMSNALKQGTTMGSKYCEVTKVEKYHFDALVKKSDKKNKRSTFDTARKQQWAQQAEAVGKDIGAKLTEAKIDDNKNFSSALATIERVVKVVFDERAAFGFHLVPETYRHSISVLLAVVHITAGNEYEP